MNEQKDNLDRAAEIFERASQLLGEAREAYLKGACGGDASLRADIDSMIEAHAEQGEFLARPTADACVTETRGSEQPGERAGATIGRYKLLQHIGEGGFGVVYMAEQTEPVKRKVALKIIKLGMDTKQVIARFEAERQALALMEHPNIAKVFDAGATETGRLYFVMELVKGVPITEYCDKNNLSTKDRLDLFMPVCHTTQHAHQKGIIHRDIKPSNVMVTLHDGKAVPKVIDFGIAKATDHRLTEKTLFTEYHQLVGTPAYMSPEQAEMSGLDVDTRTDIYSLGVLLYELLTGTTPFDAERLRQAAYGEIQRIIREVEPPKPSTRLSSLATEPGARATGAVSSESSFSSLAEIAKHRRTDPSTLGKLIRGDLDWIVMKALEKDRTRRYETAKELAKDVEHHLAHEPIVASPPGVAYRLRKFVRRNRIAVTAGSLVAAAIVVGLLVSTMGFVQASRQRDRAIVAEQEQSRERERAETARDEAEQARTAETEQRKIAESQRDLATKARQEARQLAYVANIRAAEMALSKNERARMRRSLEAAPSEFRDWEWRYLNAQTDDSLAVFRGHEEGWGLAVAFSPDGTRLVSNSQYEATMRLWNASSGSELAVLRGHEEGVLYVTFSPDGTRLASCSIDKTIRLWDAYTGEELAVLKGHEAGVSPVVFSPDGTRLASGSDDKTVRLWDVATGAETAILRGHKGGVSNVAFNPDGIHLASASSDTMVLLWNVTTGEQVATLRGHENLVFPIAFSSDGTRLASGSRDKTVRLWDVSTGSELAVMRGHESVVNWVVFSPDGMRLASGSWDSTVRLWDAATGEGLAVLRGHDGRIGTIAYSPDGTYLASASSDGIRLWNVSTGEELAVLRGHESGVNWVAFNPDGTCLASSSGDKTLRLWDAVHHRGRGILSGHKRVIEDVAFSPDGTRLASASRDNTIRLWDSLTEEELAVLRGHEGGVWSVAFSPDGTRLASGAGDKTVRLWDASTGEVLTALRGHESLVTSVAFSPDGTQLASASGEEGGDNTVRLWDASTGRELAVLQGHDGWVHSVAFSPDGTRLVSGSDDKTVRIWDTSTGEELAVLREHLDRIWSVGFSPDGTRLASASPSKLVRLWDASTLEELAAFRGQEASAYSVAFSPDGTRLALAAGTLPLLDASTGEELVRLLGQRSVVCVAFSPDGTRLASGSIDKTVRIWNTVPYRVRYQERQAIRAAQPEAERLVDRLWQQFSDARSIANGLREDTSLSGPQRRAAQNLLLRRSAQLQDQVNTLYARLVFTDDVVATLETDDSLAHGVRYKAIETARATGDKPLRLSKDSWNLVRAPNGKPEAYRVGLRGAEAAVAEEPENVDFLNTLGIAQYRNARYKEAYATLNHCDEMRRKKGRKLVPHIVAPLAMALFRLERIEEARAMFERLEELMSDDELLRFYSKAAKQWEDECRHLLEGADGRPDRSDDTESGE